MTKITLFLITAIFMVCIDLGHSTKKKKSELFKVSENCECYCPKSKSGKWKEMGFESGHESGGKWGNSKSTTRYRVSKSKGSGGSYKIKRIRKTTFSRKKISKHQAKRIKSWSKKFKASKKKSKKFGHRSLGNNQTKTALRAEVKSSRVILRIVLPLLTKVLDKFGFFERIL